MQLDCLVRFRGDLVDCLKLSKVDLFNKIMLKLYNIYCIEVKF